MAGGCAWGVQATPSGGEGDGGDTRREPERFVEASVTGVSQVCVCVLRPCLCTEQV